MVDLTDKGLGGALSDGQTLFSFLGSFWKHVYEDPDFIERFCDAIGLLSAQLEQKKNEAKAASDRTGLPPFLRERWLCVRLSESDRNTCAESEVALSISAPVIGAQPSGVVPLIGPGGDPSGAMVYRLPKHVMSAVSVHERVFDPDVSLSSSDFSILNGTISFPAGHDPISDSRFRKDEEGNTVIWLKDAMVDRNYVGDYAGYAMHMWLPSSQRALDIINAFWDVVNEGATDSGLRRFVCAVLGVPVSSRAVTTYEGYLPTYGALFLPPSFFAEKLESGLGFGSDSVSVVSSGLDANGHKKYRFDVYGSKQDADRFFEGCWRRCEARGVAMSDILGVDEASGGAVVPSTFMLRNMVGSNLVAVSIDMSQISDPVRGDIGLLGRLVDVFPVGACLMLLLSPGEVLEQYDCNAVDDNSIVGVGAGRLDDNVSAISDSISTFVVPGPEENNR